MHDRCSARGRMAGGAHHHCRELAHPSRATRTTRHARGAVGGPAQRGRARHGSNGGRHSACRGRDRDPDDPAVARRGMGSGGQSQSGLWNQRRGGEL
ncbi:hypothetical protein [Herpetosiphon gulosus]|uniref:hypothetical protein n=1 Tax=Herpetosiphon gulosus TaxID=1973496 RepID=UPI0031E7E625